jgi:hypothetical protein
MENVADENWQVLLSLFPPGWDRLAFRHRAVARLRGFPSAEALLRTLLLHVGRGYSLRETATQAKLAGLAEVSDVTVWNRLRQAEDWLHRLCQELLQETGFVLPADPAGRKVRLLDGTLIKEPGRRGGLWRIHYSLQIPTLTCDHLELTSAAGAGNGETLKRFPAREVLEWYRLRWQMELVFKRLKTLAQMGHLPKYEPASARAWLYGKLLVALLTQKLIHLGRAVSPWGYPLRSVQQFQSLAQF